MQSSLTRNGERYSLRSFSETLLADPDITFQYALGALRYTGSVLPISLFSDHFLIFGIERRVEIEKVIIFGNGCRRPLTRNPGATK